MHDSAEVWLAPRVMLVGVRVQVRPVVGDTLEVRVTVAVNELIGATVMVDVPVTPAFTVTAIGPAVIEKSGTAMV